MKRCFIVELQQSKSLPGQSFSIKPDQSTWSDNPSGFAVTNSYARPDSPPYNIRHKHFSYRIKTSIIESTSRRWYYVTNLLVACQLILTTKDNPLSPIPYSWLPAETVVTLGWLLKSYWGPASMLFNPMEHQEEKREATSIFRQGDRPFSNIVIMFGSGNNQQPCQQKDQPSESSGRPHPVDRSHSTGVPYSLSGEGKEGPQQQQHTLGLDCFVHPCHGVCRFRPSSDDIEATEWLSTFEKSSTGHSGVKPGQSSRPRFTEEHGLCCKTDFDSLTTTYLRQKLSFETLNGLSAIQSQRASSQPCHPQTHQSDDVRMHGNIPATYDDLIIIDGLLKLCGHGLLKENEISLTLTHFTHPFGTSQTQQTGRSPQLGQSSPYLSLTGSRHAIDHSGKLDCDTTLAVSNGQQIPCRSVCKNAHALSVHKKRYHSGQKACEMTMVGENGQEQPCGKLCKNLQSLSDHKQRYHTGQQICDVIMVGKDGQLKRCGKVCKSLKARLDHKRSLHTGQQTCELTMVGEDNQLQRCGKVCTSAQALSTHRYRYHAGPKACDETVVGEDGQQQPCGKIYKNASILSMHKSKYHTGQKTCDMTVFGQDDQARPCGKVCKNAQALSTHKSRFHSGQKTCNSTVDGEDGQPQPCGRACKSAQDLSNHKRAHRKRKPVDVNRDDDLSAPRGKTNR
ncbi:hypothetical protein [Endozoicomonas sp. 8E]|uniref:hypothetical protein n=1 Tax=Endozoicomonas sp. 8E TaxID=3035692 RepID=UPI0029394655|nr:hypothetical protein [Endozoicomonas sp. 8E]WOG27009.1 hypothetical protein P6910_21025 [Endozoicomonas sp. 8E]